MTGGIGLRAAGLLLSVAPVWLHGSPPPSTGHRDGSGAESVEYYDNERLKAILSHSPPACTSREALGPFRFVDLRGRVWTGRDLEGRTTIAVVWSTSCGWCISELVEVQAVFERLRANTAPMLITLNIDDSRERVSAFVEEHRYSFPVLLAPNLCEGRPKALPINWILDGRQRILKEVCGYGRGFLKDYLVPDATKLDREPRGRGGADVGE